MLSIWFKVDDVYNFLKILDAAAVAQSVRAFTPQAKGWVFECQPRQTKVVETGSGSPTAKRSAIGVSVTGLGDDHYKRMPRVTVSVAR